MLGAGPGRVKRVALGVASVVLVALHAGCYWSRYPELMETHLELLEQYGEKLSSLARAPNGIPLDAWGEFLYPLDRAKDFARIAAYRDPDRGSLRSFRVVLERYEALVGDPVYLQQADGLAELRRRRAALAQAVAETRRRLAREASAREAR